MSIVTTNKQAHPSLGSIKVQFHYRIFTSVSFISSSNSSISQSRSSIVLSTKVELIMIEEKKHGDQNNEHDNKKYENRQNSFRGKLHL